VGVPERHRQRPMAEQIPHRRKVHPGHDQMAGEGMAEVMEGKIVNAGPAAGGMEGTFHVTESVSLVIGEYIGAIDPPDERL
jgi:hypothetical protein